MAFVLGFTGNNITMDKSLLLTRLFRIIDPEGPDSPLGSVVRTKIYGFWDVVEYEHGGSYQCRCGRSEPFLLSSEEFASYKPVDPHRGCHVCQDAFDSARTKAETLAAWIDQHRASFNEKDHFLLPSHRGHLYIRQSSESNSSAIVRARNFVFTYFYKKSVPPGFGVTSTCRNPLCINPYHLCLTQSRKQTSRIKALIVTLSSKGMSTNAIQNFLHEAHSVELSQRSIQRTISGARRLKNCAT